MPIGRYAPSPTGTFHVGNLRTAIAAWLFARASDSAFLLRWEDLDYTADAAHEVTQRHDFERLGITFDRPEVRQSDRLGAYQSAIDDLTERGLTYRCWCSRREIREAAAAPHGDHVRYPGTCRHLTNREIADNEASGRPAALRLRTDPVEVTAVDRLRGPVTRTIDDIVLQRGDGTASYNLAVVVDDAFQNIGEVVRGDDLLDATPRHVHLQRLLGLAEPRWTHVPLVVDVVGERLAKRDGSAGLDHWLAAGSTVGQLIASCGRTLGIGTDEEATLPELLAAFDPDSVPTKPAVLGPRGARLSLRP